MAVGTTFTARFGCLFTIIGKVAARVLAAFFAGFAGFLTVIGEVAWVVISGISHFSILLVWPALSGR